MGQHDVLDAFNVGHMFIKLGLPVNCTQVQRFVAHVDIDGSGDICFGEFMKIARHLCEQINSKAREAYSDVEEGTATVMELLEMIVPVSYQSDIYTVASGVDQEDLDQFDFVSCVNKLRNLTRDQVKSHCGFGEAELDELQDHFNEYDSDKNGLLSGKEVQNLLETIFADLTNSQSSRPKIEEILKDACRGGAVDFHAFVRFMRKVSDLSEMERIQREKEAIETVGFTHIEVNDFREIFLGSTDREFLSLLEVQELLSAIFPMGAKNTEALSKVFNEVVADRNGKKESEFSEFLLLLHHLMESDVAGINEYAQAIAASARGESEPSSPDSGSRLTTVELLGAFKRSSVVPMPRQGARLSVPLKVVKPRM